jgi:hypothetical protein
MDEPEEPGPAPCDERLYETPPPKRTPLPRWLRCVTIAVLLIMILNLLAFLLYERF